MQLKNAARTVERALPWDLIYRGKARVCPCCQGSFRKMRQFAGRPEARCPRCGALERHRALVLFLHRELGMERLRGRLLHVAPELALERTFANRPAADYVRGDLFPQRAGIRKLDVTAIDYPDDAFDVVVINHVLEQVPDDRRAISELRRVLRTGGILITQHSRDDTRANTYEDPSLTTKAQRLEHYGNADNVRIFGRDFADRLRAGGFTVQTRRYVSEVAPGDRELYALAPREVVDHGTDIHLLS